MQGVDLTDSDEFEPRLLLDQDLGISIQGNDSQTMTDEMFARPVQIGNRSSFVHTAGSGRRVRNAHAGSLQYPERSASFSAELSVSSPRKLFIFII